MVSGSVSLENKFLFLGKVEVVTCLGAEMGEAAVPTLSSSMRSGPRASCVGTPWAVTSASAFSAFHFLETGEIFHPVFSGPVLVVLVG